MVSKKEVIVQLKRIGFNHTGWGRSEIAELPNILLADEEIYECVNGLYEGGFALLVSTNVRVLLIDKKPMSFLTVEDMRFDMISEMDYHHRLLGAEINIDASGKSLVFRSYNKHKLRKLIGHVQNCMAEIKQRQAHHQDDQVSHLEQINRQLQSYLVAQHQYQMQLQSSGGANAAVAAPPPPPPKPSNELSDYLYAQSLLAQYQQTEKGRSLEPPALPVNMSQSLPTQPIAASSQVSDDRREQFEDIYSEGVKEVFGAQPSLNFNQAQPVNRATTLQPTEPELNLDINPLELASSKLPLALRNRKFGRPSLHAHSQAPNTVTSPSQA